MRVIRGTQERPRLTVFRSNRHIYAQIIDDNKNVVITGGSTLTPEIVKKKLAGPKERAREVGKYVAKKAIEKKIKKVIFDRNSFKYHGSVKELAEGAREEGLEF